MMIALLDRGDVVVGHALIDDADAALVAPLRWGLHNAGYAARKENGRRILMHRLILGLVHGDGFETDHINRDKLDNRRSNLRVCTRAENAQNQPSRGGSSQYRGVSRVKGAWCAGVTCGGRFIHLGAYADEFEAACVAARYRASVFTHTVEDPSLLRDAA